MKIVLTDYEIKKLLKEAVEDKTKFAFGSVEEGTTYFVVKNASGEVDGIKTVEFVALFEGV